MIQMTEVRNQMSDVKQMSEAFRHLASVFCLLLLTACGFSPIYGSHDTSGAPVAEQLNQVAIDNIPDRPGQMLRNDLIDRMYGKGRPSQPLYHLSIKLRTTEESTGILANSTATLSELHTYGEYRLTDAKGKELLHGTAHSATSYGLLDQQYATLSAHDSAVERTVAEVSEQITNRLSLYFANPPKPPEETPK
jgi:LPS-assembly lipoprotein